MGEPVFIHLCFWNIYSDFLIVKQCYQDIKVYFLCTELFFDFYAKKYVLPAAWETVKKEAT